MLEPEDIENSIIVSLNDVFYKEIVPLILKRRADCNVDIFIILRILGQRLEYLQDKDRIEEIIGKSGTEEEIAFRSFYLHLGMLVKFMYPIMEQLHAAVQKNVMVITFEKEED